MCTSDDLQFTASSLWVLAMSTVCCISSYHSTANGSPVSYRQWHFIYISSVHHFYTVKRHYNGLVSPVIAYRMLLLGASLFHTKYMSLSTYLDITYPGLLQTDFLVKTLNRPQLVRMFTPVIPSSKLISVNNVPTVGAILWCRRHVARCRDGGADHF